MTRESVEPAPAGRPDTEEPSSPLPHSPGHVPGEAGIWVLILGEMIIFGIFFVILTRERVSHQALFTQSQHTLNATIGLINTVLLLTSSLFVVSGVHTVRSGRVRNASKFFVLALLCGLGFAVDKIVEYGEMLTAGLTPMTNNFYMYYYVLTGIHAFHLVIGMCVLAFLWWSTRNPTRSPKITLVEGCASYWHMVDVLWIVLFPLLYLT